MSVKPPSCTHSGFPIGHRQYEAGLGTPEQRLNFELQSLGALFHLTERLDDASLMLPSALGPFDTLKRLRWVADAMELFAMLPSDSRHDQMLRNTSGVQVEVALRVLDRLLAQQEQTR